MDIKKKLKHLPNSAGVYLMKDKNGHILYIGKASRLKNRIKSYFHNQLSLEPKIRLMVVKIYDIEIKPCDNETEALILESELIKKLRPKYNTIGRDDKSFPWIKISKEDFPIISVARPNTKENALLIGPFTSAHLLHSALKILRPIFPFRTCHRLPKKPCLNYSLQLCSAPCISKISKKQYQANIGYLRQVLEGKRKGMIKRLTLKMHSLSGEHKFEEAALVRDQIMALETLWQARPTLGANSILWQLKSTFGLKRLPLRIEGFDISNIGGNQNVGSLVSFYKTQPDYSQYRRFRVKSVSGANDYQSILEIVRRRYTRIKEEELERPDLIVVDGGQAQLGAVKKALNEIGLDIPVISIAKKNEHIFVADSPKPSILPGQSKVLHLIEQVRNEAHRFALKYHRLLRKKKLFQG